MMFVFDGANRWTSPDVIAQEALALTTLLTLVYFLWSFKRTLADTYYSALDTMYFDLLKIAMERPYLAHPSSLKEEHLREYDAYAFMVWNFVETIYDRCGKNKKLCDTWYPVIDTECARHRSWFERPENRGKFKGPFKAFIEERYPLQGADSGTGASRDSQDASLSAKAGRSRL